MLARVSTRDSDTSYSHADDLWRLLDHLAIDRAVLVGLSMGGRIVVEATLAAPERVRALVLLDAVLDGVPWDPDSARGIQAIGDGLRSGGLDEATVVDRSLNDTHSVGRVGTLCRQPARGVGLDASQMLWGCRPAGLGSACRRSARATHERRTLEWGELAGDSGPGNREELTGIATGCTGVPYADRAGGVGGHESAAV